MCLGLTFRCVKQPDKQACYNELDNLEPLIAAVAPHADETGLAWELILVDDGSSDDSISVLHALHARDARVRFLRLSRNFGQQVAICAGLDAAQGRLIVLMDADLQDPPASLPALVEEIGKGFDVVYGIRQNRGDPLLTRLSSALFWFSIRRLSGFDIPKDIGSMRIFSRRFLSEFQRFPERQKFIEGIFMWIGLRRSTVSIPRHDRARGTTKYDFWKKLQLATTAITAFSDRPLTLAITTGVGLSVAAIAFLAYISFRRIFFDVYAQGWVSTFGIVLLVGGIQTMFLGVLGKYVGRLFHEAKRRPLYILETTSADGEPTGPSAMADTEGKTPADTDRPPLRGARS